MINSIKSFLVWFFSTPNYDHLTLEERENKEDEEWWDRQW